MAYIGFYNNWCLGQKHSNLDAEMCVGVTVSDRLSVGQSVCRLDCCVFVCSISQRRFIEIFFKIAYKDVHMILLRFLKTYAYDIFMVVENILPLDVYFCPCCIWFINELISAKLHRNFHRQSQICILFFGHG